MDYEAERANFALEIPEYFNFGFDVIGKRAAEADKTAYIAIDADVQSITHHSYSDLDRASNRFANVMLDLGARTGDFAFVMIPRIPAWYEVIIGCIKTGIVAMPGTNLLTSKDIAYRINKAGARIAVVSADGAVKTIDIRDQCPTLEILIVVGGEGVDGWTVYEDACAAAPDSLAPERKKQTRADDLMLIYFTSGTTAMPKMVPRDHSYALAHTITGRYWMDLGEEDVHWTLSDTGWAKAAWGMLFPPWLAGATTILYDGAAGFDIDAHMRIIAQCKVTTFCAPPTVYRLLAQADLSGFDLSSIRHSLGAGEPLNPEVMRVWKDLTGTEIYDGYGQTETVCIVANYPGVAVRPGSMGKAAPGLDVNVVDDKGKIVDVGTIGHIAVRLTDPPPLGLFDGYQGDPEATAKGFHDGWYFTGDTATRDVDDYIWFVGRADDVISSSGYRISPFEVESTLIEHPAVAESAVVGKPDSMRGEIVMAYIILASGFTQSEALKEEIQEFVKAQTAPYKYPRAIEFRETLPKTISGKIRRTELRDEARNME